MMDIKIETPTLALLDNITDEELKRVAKALTYRNESADYMVKKLSQNYWFKNKNPSGWAAAVRAAKEKVVQTLVFRDGGKVYIRPSSIGYIKEIVDIRRILNKVEYPEFKPIKYKKPLPFDLYDYQEESTQKLLAAKHANVSLCTGCHEKGTKILMYSGELKSVEDIRVGDLLMGPDSTPRTVLKLHRGSDKMFKVTPKKGESFTVNGGHILSLQRTNTGNTYLRKDGTRYRQENGENPIINISVYDYLKLSAHDKHLYKLYRAKIDFKNFKELPIPPYIYGIWLGDGNSDKAAITTMDDEISKEWIKYIPFEYLTSSVENRLELLAGLIDTNGYHDGRGGFSITQKSEQIATDIVYLARSLGFGVTIRSVLKKCQTGACGKYFTITISGSTDTIPTRLKRKKATKRKQNKNVLRVGFTACYSHFGEYYGFEVDGDNLYVMGDFTVTHNSGKTAVLMELARRTGLKTSIIVPAKSIFLELLEKLEFHFGKDKIGTFGNGKKKIGKPITLCIGDSLCNVEPNTPEWEFFSNQDVAITDESHTWGAETLEQVCHGVFKDVPYRFFLSGTQTRSGGDIKLLQSIIGPTVHTLTTKEAKERGFISDHEYRIIKVHSSNPNFSSQDVLELKRMHLLRNQNIAEMIAKIANKQGSEGKQMLVLVEELEQISMLTKLLTVPYAIAHSESKKEKLDMWGLEKVNNKESVDKFNQNKVKVLIGTSCIRVGTNIYPTHVTAWWCGGSSEINTKQGAVGRSIRLGNQNPYKDQCLPKDKAIIIDFDIIGQPVLHRHLENRIGYYSDSGSVIKWV